MTFGIAMLVAFLVLIGFAAFADNINPPSGMQQIDPTKVSQTPPFDKPGLHRLADGSYEAYYVAQVFSFNPATLTIPLGSKAHCLDLWRRDSVVHHRLCDFRFVRARRD